MSSGASTSELPPPTFLCWTLSLRGASGDTAAPLADGLVARELDPRVLGADLNLLEGTFETDIDGFGAALGPPLATAFEVAAFEPTDEGATFLPDLGTALELLTRGATCLPVSGAALEPLEGATLELRGD